MVRRRNRKQTKNKKKLPLTQEKRKFGEFECPKCKRKWMSGHSWTNMGQKCLKCRINVYPYKQRPLFEKLPNNIDSTKPHIENLCEMCKKMKINCTKL